MKKFLIGLVLDQVFDLFVLELLRFAARSDNDLDDDMISVIRDHKPMLINSIKSKL